MAAVCMWHETLDQGEITRRNAGFPEAGVVGRACAVASSPSSAQSSSRAAVWPETPSRASLSHNSTISEFKCCVVSC